MKYVYTALLVPILFLSGVYIGLEWGLSAKPVIDESKCQIVTRYEDNTLVCEPIHTTLPVEDEGDSNQTVFHDFDGYQASYNPQETQDAWHLQPARGEQ